MTTPKAVATLLLTQRHFVLAFTKSGNSEVAFLPSRLGNDFLEGAQGIDMVRGAELHFAGRRPNFLQLANYRSAAEAAARGTSRERPSFCGKENRL